MPLNRAALAETDPLTRKDLPDLAEDEYLEIRKVRDYPRDVAAERASARWQRPIPQPGETDEAAAARENVLERDDAVYVRQVLDYMLVRAHVRDETGAWMDADPASPAGTPQDRDDMIRVWGPLLQYQFLLRMGRLRPSNLEGKVNPATGEPLTFPGSGVPDAQGDPPGSAQP